MIEFFSKDMTPNTIQIRALDSGVPVTFAQFLDLLITSSQLRSDFNDVLINLPFRSYFWECTPLDQTRASQPFEAVFVKANGLADRELQKGPFAQALSQSTDDVICFENLGGDAQLIVPQCLADDAAYTDIASFCRGAPANQIDQLWALVGATALERLSDDPIWLNTSGGGVAWLHVRLDSSPKYYSYAPYRLRS